MVPGYWRYLHFSFGGFLLDFFSRGIFRKGRYGDYFNRQRSRAFDADEGDHGIPSGIFAHASWLHSAFFTFSDRSFFRISYYSQSMACAGSFTKPYVLLGISDKISGGSTLYLFSVLREQFKVLPEKKSRTLQCMIRPKSRFLSLI